MPEFITNPQNAKLIMFININGQELYTGAQILPNDPEFVRSVSLPVMIVSSSGTALV